MSDIEAGARAPDTPRPARRAADKATRAAAYAASDVTDTATEQARQVGGEVTAQARNVAADVRDKATQQARVQNDRLVDNIRRMADDLDRMSAERGDSPAASVVRRIASGGRQAADYLSERGPEGVLGEVQDFARRRPGAFLATALVTGFVVGRLGRSVLAAAESPAPAGTKPTDDAFVSGPPGHPAAPVTPAAPTASGATAAATEYAATGTGTPVPVTEPVPGAAARVQGTPR
jgi:hypothetical protein